MQPQTKTLKLANGVEFRYTDSGAPPSSTHDYFTLVGFHGTGFNNGIFTPLHQHAHQRNLRTIFVDRRGYGGSTPYSDAETEDLNAGKQAAYDAEGLEVAEILAQLVDGEEARNLAVMGWSRGNVLVMSLLGNPGAIPKELYAKLEAQVRSFVLYDPPLQVLGLRATPEQVKDLPFIQPDVLAGGPLRVGEGFNRWVTGYYTHPDIASGQLSGVWFGGGATRFTMDGWTSEERASWCEPLAGAAELVPDPEGRVAAIRTAQTQRAVFDAGVVSEYFPRAKVLYLTGEETVGSCMWAYMYLQRRVKEAERSREVKFELVPKTNHFMHYDAAAEFMDRIVDSVQWQ
ncbi:AB hydrolase-1 domain-containing protein [Mycena kentingensis (nom. inval.)]|nr:AB hydrolase-1 domain-containing protein [Mycena kentingensis (nom. inval.)]